jgi:predicted NBD/HSP70 family sugar kinase
MRRVVALQRIQEGQGAEAGLAASSRGSSQRPCLSRVRQQRYRCLGASLSRVGICLERPVEETIRDTRSQDRIILAIVRGLSGVARFDRQLAVFVHGESGMREPLVPGSLGHVLACLREGAGNTRPGLVESTGMSRTAVVQRLEALIRAGLVVEDGVSPSTGGRRATRLRFAHESGVVLAADLGATHSRLAVTDLAGAVLAERVANQAIAAGPVTVLGWVCALFDELLGEVGRSPADVRGVGIGVPGPVEHAAGRAISPPIMPGWDNYPISEHVGDRFGEMVLVDNDVNIMALGEYSASWKDLVQDLLFIKVGTGIGAGIVASGQIHRGAQGAAGDLGHVRVAGHDEVVCRCGNVGCVEAIAGGQAIADRLVVQGYETPDARSVVKLVLAGDREAIREVRECGRVIGQVLAAAVNFFNPAVVVVGGDVAEAHEQLLAGIRETVYQRSLPLATRHLRLVHSRLGDRAGIHGASVMVIDRILSPSSIENLVGDPRLTLARTSGT